MLRGVTRRTRRTTLTLDADALELAERVARLRRTSVSAIASRALRNEALRLGAPSRPPGDEADAAYDEAERLAMEEEDRPDGRAA